MIDQFKEVRELFEDTVTHLPHHVLLQPTLEKSLKADASLGLIVVNVEGLDPIEEAFGHVVYQKIVREFSISLQSLQGRTIRKTDYLALSELGGSSFMIFLTSASGGKRKRKLERSHVDMIAERVKDKLFESLIGILRNYSQELPKLSVGQAFVIHNPLLRKRRLINMLIEEAKEMARLQTPINRKKYKEMLHKIIVNREITTVFQPILSAEEGIAMGVEALSRGPKGTIFESPLALFSIAEEVNLVYELDCLCRQKAFENGNCISSKYKIFVNTLPKAAQDPEFQRVADQMGRNKERHLHPNIVFEINEREAIGSFALFKRVMQQCMNHGVDFAVDDIGAGYSSLETIVQLRPKFMKIDRSLISGICNDPLKQDMVKMLANFAKRIDAELVAEGIETQNDANLIRQMGIHHVQGYYYAKPMTLEELIKSRLIDCP
jgi:EAL domain-containing protein (putative c-di-GMP-specific phosphodiesterase class I)/GGDEF domain-containing protein